MFRSFIITLGSFVILISSIGFILDYFAKSNPTSMRTHDQRYESFVDHIYQQEHQTSNIYFLGTSRTMCSIIPEVVEEGFDQSSEKSSKAKVYNYGINWYGQNIKLSLMRRLIEKKNITHFVLEVPYLKRYHSHRNFKMICSFEEALSAPIFGNHQYFNDVIFTPFRQIYQLYLNTQLSSPSPLLNQGYTRYDLSSEQLNETRKRFQSRIDQNNPITASDIELKGTLSKLKYQYFIQPIKSYFHQFRELCEQHNIKLILLGVPKFNLYEMTKSDREFYQSIGTLILPPADLMHRSNFWRDDSHYTYDGAKVYSKWVAKQIQKTFHPSLK